MGSAIWNNLKQRGYNNLVGRTHKELDLLDPVAVKRFFDEERPEAVVLAAAHVGASWPTLITGQTSYIKIFKYNKMSLAKVSSTMLKNCCS